MKKTYGRNRRTDPDPEDIPPGKGAGVHLRLSQEEAAELDKIAGWMKLDPKIRRLKANIGREKAIRYAIGHIIDHPPEHVGAARG
jgi:hypothetical protein